MATGMDAALAEAILEVACLPDITPDLLTLVEGALLFISSRDGTVSMQSVQAEIRGCLTGDRLQTIFFALVQAGVLIRQKRDQRGHAYDGYHVDPDRLHQIVHDVSVARHVLTQMQAEGNLSGQVELIATLPDNLSLDPEIRRAIPSLAAALHRLITEAEREIIILNPFFEPSGFERLATALVEATRRGVTITIISSRLVEPTSVNYRVINKLIRRALAEGLRTRFKLYEYRRMEGYTATLLHAKILMADGRLAYIGSANLTEYGLAHNLEIGLLSTGPHLQQLQGVLHAILQSDRIEAIDEFP